MILHAALKWSSVVARTCASSVSASQHISKDTYNQHGCKSSDDEAEINSAIRCKDEPAIPRSTLQFTRTLGSGNRSSRILATNGHTDQETVSCQRCKQATDTASRSVGARSKSSKHDQEYGTDVQRPFPGPFVSCIAEDENSEDGSSKRNGGDVPSCCGVGVFIWVDTG